VIQRIDTGGAGFRERLVETGGVEGYEWGFFAAIGLQADGPLTPPPPPPADYDIETQSEQALVPGTIDIGNH